MTKLYFTSWSAAAIFMGFLIPLTSFFLVTALFKISKSADSMVYLSEHANLASLEKPTNISLLFVGDIMLGRGVEQSVLKNAGGDFSFLFQKAGFIKNADIAFGNLEGPAAAAGQNSGSIYSFRFNPNALKELINAGFDVLSVANNHAGDWGKEAFEETLSILNNQYVYSIGGGFDRSDAASVKVLKWKGVSFGFLGFSDVGPEWFKAGENEAGIITVGSDDNFSSLIKEAVKKTDVLVVSIHFGEEYEIKANKRQKHLAHLAIDSGANIVVGHHPHVVQEVEKYKNGIIAYSLGNFIFDQNFSEETMEGLAVEVYFEDKEIVAFKKNKIKINQFFQPCPEGI